MSPFDPETMAADAPLGALNFLYAIGCASGFPGFIL